MATSKVETKTESDFGKGLTYCLGLFLCHAERDRHADEKLRALIGADSWFNGASDHLYEMEIPEALPEPLRKRLGEFQDKCLSWGHGFGMDGRAAATDKDREWAIDEAKSLLMEIDAHFGIATCEASWK
jgi:hypothetical protein